MDGQPELFQRPQQALQGVGKEDGGGGIGQQEGAGDKHHDPQDHEEGGADPLPVDLEDPEGHQGLPLSRGIEKVEDSGEDDDKQDGLHASDQDPEAHMGDQDTAGQGGKHKAVA